MAEVRRTEETPEEGGADIRRRMYIFAAVLLAVLVITIAIYATL